MNNEPAFPALNNETQFYVPGLTKREYISAMNMQGLLAAWGQHDVTNFDEIAHDAVKAADALLAELEKTQS